MLLIKNIKRKKRSRQKGSKPKFNSDRLLLKHLSHWQGLVWQLQQFTYLDHCQQRQGFWYCTKSCQQYWYFYFDHFLSIYQKLLFFVYFFAFLGCFCGVTTASTITDAEKLQKKIDDMNQDSARIAADIGTYKAQNKIDDLQKTIKEIKESIAITEERIEDASETVRKLHEEIVKIKAKLGDLGATKDARCQELEEFQKRILDKEKALKSLRKAHILLMKLWKNSNILHSRLRISQDTTESIRSSLESQRKEIARTLKERKTRTNVAQDIKSLSHYLLFVFESVCFYSE